MRILVVEDQNAIRRMIEALVSARGHEVAAVASGLQAIEEASSGRFDLVLLDLNLPGQFDGFAVCKKLREDPITREVPIFVISALDDPSSRARAHDAGASAFYAKPFSPIGLLREIDRVGSASPSGSTPSNTT